MYSNLNPHLIAMKTKKSLIRSKHVAHEIIKTILILVIQRVIAIVIANAQPTLPQFSRYKMH